MMESEAMTQPGSGIEVTAHCPPLMPQYKLNKVELEIDGAVHSIEWDQPAFFAASPGVHRVKVGVHGRLAKSGARRLDVGVEAGHVAEVAYSLSMLSLINPGKLELKGKRPSA